MPVPEGRESSWGCWLCAGHRSPYAIAERAAPAGRPSTGAGPTAAEILIGATATGDRDELVAPVGPIGARGTGQLSPTAGSFLIGPVI
jgi:hypothetical protein